MAHAHPRGAEVIPAPRISLEEARAKFDRGEALFLDVRSPGAYRFSRIPGAVNIPLRELGRRMHELPKDRLIITY